jgi:ribonuclease Z
MADFTMTVIGCGSALPMHGRHPSAQVVQYGDLYCLIDCGEGTQDRLKEAGVKSFKISHILISHLHGDHIFGLPGLISSFTHLKRTEALTIYGPVGLKGLMSEIIRYTDLKISYPLTIIEKEPKRISKILSFKNFEILTFPLYHRISCNGYVLREMVPEIRLNKAAVGELDLTPEQLQSLKRGDDILYKGRVLANEKLTLGRERPVSYAYCSDTKFDLRLIASIRKVSVLYHETTFMNVMASMAQQTGHSTAGEAGEMAAAAGVSCLITGHYSSRYKSIEGLITEAEEKFRPVLAAEEGKKYNLRTLAG